MEEVSREVIYIHDDSTDGGTDTAENNASPESEGSIEIVSNQATARELQPDHSGNSTAPSGDMVRRIARKMVYLQSTDTRHSYIPQQVDSPPSAAYAHSSLANVISAKHRRPLNQVAGRNPEE
jgi:hypothetical protein